MIAPAEAIDKDVSALCSMTGDSDNETALAEDIQKNGNTIAELLDNLIKLSDEEKRKEEDYEQST